MSVTLGPGDTPSVAAPEALFEDRLPGLGSGDHTAFAPDGDGGLFALEVPERPPVQDVRIALDWMEAVGLDR